MQATRLGITPRGLSLAEAAAYVGLSPRLFRREVNSGTLPPPLPFAGRRRVWDRGALDRALELRSNAAGGDPVLQAILAAGAARAGRSS